MNVGESRLKGGWCSVAFCMQSSKDDDLARPSCIIFIARIVLCPHSTSCWILQFWEIHTNLPRPGENAAFILFAILSHIFAFPRESRHHAFISRCPIF